MLKRFLILSLILLPQVLHAAKRPKIALVLSGGGPRGKAHLGVVKALEDMRVPIDLIVGCSAGSLAGGLLAQGYSMDETRQAIADLDFFKLYDDSVPRAALPFRLKDKDINYLSGLNLGLGEDGLRAPRGLSSGRRLRLASRRLALRAVGVEDFNQLSIPFLAASTDMTRAKALYLGQGDLGEAVMASMSVPASFAPMMLSGAAMTDGFILRNLPIDGAKAWGADVVIVVDITTAFTERSDYSSVLDATMRLLDIVVEDGSARQRALLGPRDVLLQPKTAFLGNFDYHRSDEAFQPGVDAVNEAAEKLKSLVLSPQAYAAWKAGRRVLKDVPWRLRKVRSAIEGREGEYTLERVRAKAGEVFDPGALEADIEALMASGRYEDVDYRLEHAKDGEVDLVLDPRPKSWGPDYLNVGFKLASNFEGMSEFETLIDFTQTGFISSDLELRHQGFLGRVNGYDGELFMPAHTSGLFAAPAVLAENRSGLSLLHGRLDIGWVGRAAEFRFGYGVGHLWIGPANSKPLEVDIAMLRAQLIVDTLDHAHFPSHGVYVKAMAGEARGDLVTAPAYRVARGGGHWVNSLGPHTFILGGELASAWDSAPPPFEHPSLGGFFRLSGYRVGSKPGRESALTRGIYYYKVTKPMALLGSTTVLGFSYETGQAFASSIDFNAGPWPQSLALILGMSTPIGPAYLAHARNFEGGGASYFYLGSPF